MLAPGMARIGTNERTGQGLAVVVGAGGMGMAVARRLGNTHRLLLADRDAAHLERQIAALRAEGHDARGAVCDVVDAVAVRVLAKEAAAAGPLTALAHVVGLSPSMADGATILRVNLMGPTLVADALGACIAPGGAGLFVSSLAAHLVRFAPEVEAALGDALAGDVVARVESALGRALDSSAAYQLSKLGVIRLCRKRAAEWGARGARILSLSPGLIATPMGAREFEAQPEKRRLFEMTPLGREGTLVEIADAVEFLLSERASFISGVDLRVDGGLGAAASGGEL